MKPVDQASAAELEDLLLLEPLRMDAIEALHRDASDEDLDRLERVLLRALLHISENSHDDSLQRHRATLYRRLEAARIRREVTTPLNTRWIDAMRAKEYDEAWCLSAVLSFPTSTNVASTASKSSPDSRRAASTSRSGPIFESGSQPDREAFRWCRLPGTVGQKDDSSTQ